MDLPGGIDPWDQPGEAGGEHDPSESALAFAAYDDAWHRRRGSGEPGDGLLRAALREHRVPTPAYAEGTLLHETLWSAWAADRGPRRMHLTVARYRLRRVLRAPRAFVDLFRDPTPEQLRVPTDLRRLRTDREVDLPFQPVATLWPRLAAAWADLDVVDGDDLEPDELPWAELTVWLDPVAHGTGARVVLGDEPVGSTVLAATDHAALLDRTDRRGRRVVADARLLVERAADGQFRVGHLTEACMPGDED